MRCFALKWRRETFRVPGALLQVDLARASVSWYGETRCCLRYSFVHADSLRPLASHTAVDFFFVCGAAAGARCAGLVREESEVDQRPASHSHRNSSAFVP